MLEQFHDDEKWLARACDAIAGLLAEIRLTPPVIAATGTYYRALESVVKRLGAFRVTATRNSLNFSFFERDFDLLH